MVKTILLTLTFISCSSYSRKTMKDKTIIKVIFLFGHFTTTLGQMCKTGVCYVFRCGGSKSGTNLNHLRYDFVPRMTNTKRRVNSQNNSHY